MSPRTPASKSRTRSRNAGRGAAGAGGADRGASGGRSTAQQHRAWLGLVDTEGPFLSVPVLTGLYPQGIPGMSRERREVLRIDRGRFSRPTVIAVNEIVRCTLMKTAFGLSHYLLIEYGERRMVSVTPDNSEAFIAELKKRQEQNEE